MFSAFIKHLDIDLVHYHVRALNKSVKRPNLLNFKHLLLFCSLQTLLSKLLKMNQMYRRVLTVVIVLNINVHVQLKNNKLKCVLLNAKGRTEFFRKEKPCPNIPPPFAFCLPVY